MPARVRVRVRMCVGVSACSLALVCASLCTEQSLHNRAVPPRWVLTTWQVIGVIPDWHCTLLQQLLCRSDCRDELSVDMEVIIAVCCCSGKNYDGWSSHLHSTSHITRHGQQLNKASDMMTECSTSVNMSHKPAVPRRVSCATVLHKESIRLQVYIHVHVYRYTA